MPDPRAGPACRTRVLSLDVPLDTRTSAVVVAAHLVILLAVGGSAADQTASEFAEALQRHYDTIKDFSADFTHTYQGGVLRKHVTERGHVAVRKPGRMRWDYTEPERKVFVSDGTKMYAYIPEDKQVTVTSVPADDRAAGPVLFLAGKGNLTRDFTPSLVAVPSGLPSGATAIKLVPRMAQPEYDWIILVVEPGRLGLRGLVTSDAQGGTSSLSFTNLKENVGLTDKDFVFTIPRNVDVVTTSSAR